MQNSLHSRFGRFSVSSRVLTVLATALFTACADPASAPELSPQFNKGAPNNKTSTVSLSVSVSGLPSGTPASIRVTGPNNYSSSVSGSTTLSGLAAGTYNLSADPVAKGSDSYTASPAAQSVSVKTTGKNSASVKYTKQLTPGALNVNISAPSGVTPSVTVTGPGGFSRTLTASGSLTGLADGSYSVSASSVTVSGTSYNGSPASQSVSVKAGTTASASVSYAAVVTTGTLNVTVSAPSGVSPSVTVTGPNSFTRTISGTTSLTGLPAGIYAIAATDVTVNGVVYGGSPASQSSSVTAGATAAAAVAYSATGVQSGGEFNLQIVGMYLTQAVQTMSSGVTVIAGKPAVLRVFGVANTSNSARPEVRVRLYQNGVLVNTLSSTLSASATATTIDENNGSTSWNFSLPADVVRPGLSILADIDPTNVVAEASDSDNVYPADGKPWVANVRAVPVLNVKFVPIHQSVNSLTGNITTSNADAMLQHTRDMLPVGEIRYSIRSPMTTTSTLVSNGGGWSMVLSELYALRTSDKSNDLYYGVAKVDYGSGVAGVGYVGSPASMGWDYSGSGGLTMAHELGHNFGRRHAPCGGVANPDAYYPYSGGVIGATGWNLRTNSIIPSTAPDLMGYCSPSWISDYNYNAMMSFRGFASGGYAAANTTSQDGLLVWGRIDANGEIVLEPVVPVSAPASVPITGGDYTVEARDADGRVVFSYSFAPLEVADVNDGGHFAFVVPMSESTQEALATVEVRGRGKAKGRTRRQSNEAMSMTVGSVDVSTVSGNRLRVRWNAAQTPMVVVRDPVSGEIVAFARGGDAIVETSRADVEVIATDGVGASKRRVRARGR